MLLNSSPILLCSATPANSLSVINSKASSFAPTTTSSATNVFPKIPRNHSVPSAKIAFPHLRLTARIAKDCLQLKRKGKKSPHRMTSRSISRKTIHFCPLKRWEMPLPLKKCTLSAACSLLVSQSNLKKIVPLSTPGAIPEPARGELPERSSKKAAAPVAWH